MPDRHASRATVMGLVAVVLWSSSVAFIRALSESLGPTGTIVHAYLLGGLLAVGIAAFRPGGLGRFGRLPRAYLWGCGALFVTYTTCYCAAVGLATDRGQVLAVGLVNYLWPSLTLLLSVPILGYRARWFLGPGMLVATAGMVVAATAGSSLSLAGLRAGVSANGPAFALALVGAVTWALYSNLARRWGGEGGGVPLFVLASGLVALPLRFWLGETSTWNARVVGELIYMALFVTVIAYVFWDQAMRKGNVVLVAAVSYSTPLLSTIFTAAYLRVAPGPAIWMACALVIVGAAVCRLAVDERPPDP
jgi:drug/metabolite transporter (DMT)-like permease